tara:strand:- start:230 stop:463 length:234 start_codon:yes stop_codon:yes gene_type:complete
MKFVLDLHGLPMKDALIKAENFLIEASFDKNMECEIITGKSGNMKERIIEELLIPYKFEYYVPIWNEGMLIVTQDVL